MLQEDTFSGKLEMILVNLMRSGDIRVRIDDRGIYWGSRYQEREERFILFNQMDDTPITEIVASTRLGSGTH